MTPDPSQALDSAADAAPPAANTNEAAALEGPGFRSLPHNIAAEKALLGAIFVNNKAHERVAEFLRPEHFAIAAHGKIFRAAAQQIERGQIADPVTLRRFFEQDENLSEIGGPVYMMELAAAGVPLLNAAEYGRLIYDLHLKRELIDLGETVVNRAYSGEVEDSANTQIESAEQRLYNLAEEGEIEGGFKPFTHAVKQAVDAAEAAFKRDGRLAGVTTGFRDVDQLLGGLHPSDLLILAGRPSMGKTALATNIAYNAARAYQKSGGEEGAVIGFFSLEMSAEQLAGRIISETTQIPSDKMRKGQISNVEFHRLSEAIQELERLPLFIDDAPALTVGALRTRARRLKRQHNLGLIVVDYLQLITAAGISRSDGRVQEVSEITRGLKTLAKELNVPVLALSQLSRAVEQRDNKRPQLSDLRESGSIEQDADVVTFIFREEYYLERDKPSQHGSEKEDSFNARVERHQDRLEKSRNIAEVLVAKQRHGPIGDVRLRFEGQYTRFEDLDEVHNI
ncbi:MAG: replicative DNA helicase [Rhodospirillales bacterium]